MKLLWAVLGSHRDRIRKLEKRELSPHLDAHERMNHLEERVAALEDRGGN